MTVRTSCPVCVQLVSVLIVNYYKLNNLVEKMIFISISLTCVHLRSPLQRAFTDVICGSNSPPFILNRLLIRILKTKLEFVSFYQSCCVGTQNLTVLKSRSVFVRRHRWSTDNDDNWNISCYVSAFGEIAEKLWGKDDDVYLSVFLHYHYWILFPLEFFIDLKWEF